MAIVVDDRTDEQKKTHTVLIVGLDRFLTGWGLAAGGKSWAAWACRPETTDTVEAWVERRSDMTRVRRCPSNYKPSGRGHFHIYVVDAGHPAIYRAGSYFSETLGQWMTIPK